MKRIIASGCFCIGLALVISQKAPLYFTQQKNRSFVSQIDVPSTFGKTHFIVGQSEQERDAVINQPPAAPLATPTVYFSPDDDVRTQILNLIKQEQKAIRIAVFAFNMFSEMFKARTIKKTYLAVVQGHPDKEGTIDKPIGRCHMSKIKMATYPKSKLGSGHKIRHAITHYKVAEYFKDYSLVEVTLVTGRTHQIRVHFAAIGHPLVGDATYGSASSLINRQALHSHRLSFTFDNTDFNFSSDAPADFFPLLTP